MKLEKYLKKNNLSVREFARQSKISHTSIQRYKTGERTPRLEVALKIEKLTNGEVKVKDLCPAYH